MVIMLTGRKIVANRKMGKLDMYAETRIWNLKLKNRNMSTEDLIKEMIFRFRLVGKTSLYLRLKKIIVAARRRVMRRRTAMKKSIRVWAEKLSLPEKAVEEMAWSGHLKDENIKTAVMVLTSYRETHVADQN
jgi:hypothetical protein